MDSGSDEDFDYSDDEDIEDDHGSKPEEKPEKRVIGAKHLLQLKETLQLDSFKAKTNTKCQCYKPFWPPKMLCQYKP
jgi:hypothetical protein